MSAFLLSFPELFSACLRTGFVPDLLLLSHGRNAAIAITS